MIHILDENLKKIEILRKYDFLQYVQKFRGIGTFTIHAQLIDENKYLLDETKTFYVLFDFDELVFGEIIKTKQEGEGDNNKIILITGYLENYLFTKKIVKGTLNYTSKTYELCSGLVRANLCDSEQPNRFMNINISYNNEEYMKTVTSDIKKQITGGYIWDGLEPLLVQDNLGIVFKPIVSTEHLDSRGNKTNISEWSLMVSAGDDRTKNNVQGLTPIIFSQQLSNIAMVNYEHDSEQYSNYVYLAGEGQGSDREWFEHARDNLESFGWNRKELWIDARDIQRTDSETGETLIEDEYKKLINQRIEQKLAENVKTVTYEATATNVERLYKYGEDFFLGDWCTVSDDELNKEVDVQITEITRTIQGSRSMFDIKFSYGLTRKKYDIANIKTNSLKIEEIQSNVKYLEHISKRTNDFIIETGKYGIWTYRKWDSGIMECWGEFTQALNFAQNIYYGSNMVTAVTSGYTYPCKYIEPPIDVCSVHTALRDDTGTIEAIQYPSYSARTYGLLDRWGTLVAIPLGSTTGKYYVTGRVYVIGKYK